MTAYCLIRKQPVYRQDAFVAGLKSAGFDVRVGTPVEPRPDDILLIWNRYGDFAYQAQRFEKAGARVLVAENGYMGAGGTAPKFDVTAGPQAGHYYALALGHHNGRGVWPTGDGSRWAALGVPLKPWGHGDYVLVCPNRSFGEPDRLMPSDWGELTVRALAKVTQRPVRLRQHPGNSTPARPLAEDLAGAHAVVIWHSSAGVHALVQGVPVVCMGPWWICKDASFDTLDAVQGGAWDQPWDTMYLDMFRLKALQRMAWAQWTIDEIASGEPFKRLLWHDGK